MRKWVVVINNKWYEKYTSTIRAFGGQIQLTENLREARLYTRKRDAEHRAYIIRYRINKNSRYKNLQRERAEKKYSIKKVLTARIKQIED